MLALITAPQPVVTLAEAKKHLRVEHGDDDTYIEALVATATGWIDGPAGWLGRALGPQTVELRVHGSEWACRYEIVLPCPPLIAVESVTYLDQAGAPQTLAAETYTLVGAGATGIAHLARAHGASWPAVRPVPEAVRIRYRAGYETGVPAAPAVPPTIKAAILLLVGHLYSHRESVTTLREKPEELPMGVDALLSPFRVWS